MDDSQPASTNQTQVAAGGDLGSPRGIVAESSGQLVVAVNNPGCLGLVRVNPVQQSVLCFAKDDRMENPMGVAVVQAPEPTAALLQLASLATLALLGRRRLG